MVYSCHGILFCNKKEENTDISNNLVENPENYAEWKESTPKDHILFDSMYTHSENDKISEMKNRLVVFNRQRRSGDGRELGVVIKQHHEGSLRWWNSSVSWPCQWIKV